LRARAQHTTGERALGQLDFSSSAPALEQAVELATVVDDQPTIGWAQMFLAVVYANRGEVDKAIRARDEALRVAERYVIPSVTAGAYYWVGSVNATLGDNEGAELYLTRAVDLAREVGSPYTLARFLPLVARRLHAVGNHAEAMRVFEEAIELSRAAGDRIGLVRSLQYMAERNIASGDYAMALERLEEAHPIVSREIDDPTLACRVELTSATLWRHRGDLERAQEHVESALMRAEGLKGWRTSMDPYLTQAEVALDAGNTEGALIAITRSVEQAREANHPERLARALVVEARVRAELGHVDAATDALTEAEKLWDQPNDPAVVALIRGARGRIALADSRVGEAATWFSEAADIAGTAGARLLSIENTEDLAAALWAADPSDDRAAKLLAEASHQREALGAPRPPARVIALAGLGCD
jgi:tetratricopeptide (TPR) repeat protein